MPEQDRPDGWCEDFTIKACAYDPDYRSPIDLLADKLLRVAIESTAYPGSAALALKLARKKLRALPIWSPYDDDPVQGGDAPVQDGEPPAVQEEPSSSRHELEASEGDGRP